MQETLVQIRHVPQSIHRTLKARAAKRGLSLSDYLLQQIIAIAERPTIENLIERVRSHEVINEPINSVTAVRKEREGRK
ncbi:MAG: hypothetical protein JW841_03965 [Deltaproteobacteria bacterium]|nr:hypothetical protein [Deltaproteobacteria bacterium]